MMAFAEPIGAHVKWFSDFDFADPPRSLGELVTTEFLSMAIAGMVVISLLVVIDRRLEGFDRYQAINQWLSRREPHSETVARFAMAALLLVSWENEALLAPELPEEASWIGWYQFVLVALLLFRRSARIGGAGIVGLWLIAVGYHGAFHMLDYLHYVGLGVYLFFAGHEDKGLRGLGLPVLYATVGFALMWAGLEKLVYPEWGLFALEQNPGVVLGVSPELFLELAAFIEIGIGFLLIVGLLERPLALIITVVFFGSTLVFGRAEVVGHTPLHAALVVFLFSGPETAYPAPIDIHRQLSRRMTFAAANFGIALAIFTVVYVASAQAQFDGMRVTTEAGFEIAAGSSVQFTSVEILTDAGGRQRLHVELSGWTFRPASVDHDPAPNEGYAVLWLDRIEVGRLYSPWLDLGDLPRGDHLLEIELRAVDDRPFTAHGQPIASSLAFTTR